jgi:hypothetical protein
MLQIQLNALLMMCGSTTRNINKLCNVASCWIYEYIAILLGARPVLHNSRIKVKMDLQELGGGRGDWMELAQDRDSWLALVGTVRDFRVPFLLLLLL